MTASKALAVMIVTAVMAAGCGEETDEAAEFGRSMAAVKEAALALTASAAALRASATPPRVPPETTTAVPPPATETTPRPEPPEEKPPDSDDRGMGQPEPTEPDGTRPDGPGNDVPPPPGSPAQKFERFCERLPEACD